MNTRTPRRPVMSSWNPGDKGGVWGVTGVGGGGRAWWSDAANDPWRDPASPTVIVTRTPVSEPPADPGPEVVAAPKRGFALVVWVAVVAGLLAGTLGGAVCYLVAAKHDSPGVMLGAGPRQPPAPTLRNGGSVSAVVPRVMPSVVTVQAPAAQGESLGSGFVISSDGHILTNEHVIADMPDQAVRITLSDTTTLPAQVVGRDPESDLAVLKVDRKDLRAVEFGNSDAVAVGDAVLAIGAPLALPGTVTAGIVSALDRTIETHDAGGPKRYYAAIQTDAAINHGNSGGPLFDLAGRVIGINSVIKSVADNGEEAGNIGIAFAIPINQAGRIASEIIDTGRARRTVIGAQLDTYQGPGGGVLLTAVDAGGPAATAGLRSGDVVVRIGTHQIEQKHDLIALVRRYDPGTVVTVVYRRGTGTQTTSVTLVADAN
jgi:putative serine protease PepD